MNLLTELFQKSKSEWQNQKPGLERITAACEFFGNPQNKFKSIHIAGTNGKGSTAAMLQSILTQAGLKVGLFTSPHLVKINERFRIGYEDIEDERLTSVILNLFQDPHECTSGDPDLRQDHKGFTLHASLPPLTFFELCTLIAFLYFAQEQVDIAIIETGLGGRLDSTNIITPIVSVLTEIGLDHTEFLGPDIASIAKEKAGIIKEGIPVICGTTQKEAIEVIQKMAEEKNASLFFPSPLEGERQIKLSLSGLHQQKNAAIALKVIELLCHPERSAAQSKDLIHRSFTIVQDDIEKGLQNVKWPGRLEIVQNNPLIILDGAHNVEGIKAVVETLTTNPTLILPLNSRGGGEGFGCTPINWKILFSAAADKNVDEMLSELRKLSNEIYLCKMENSRSIAAELSTNEAYSHLSKSLKNNEALLVIGSLYLVGEIKQLLSQMKATS